ncbi:hypothetical protein [Candidatus Spongiihabitans sp.]
MDSGVFIGIDYGGIATSAYLAEGLLTLAVWRWSVKQVYEKAG